MHSRRLRKILRNAETIFLDCWNMLAAPKFGEIETFQPRLAACLYDLSSHYRAIKQERDSLITRKKRLNAGWFASEQKRLSQQQDALAHAVNVGKSIGDSFAWLWFRNCRSYLQLHRPYPDQLLMPPKAGGWGEVGFIQYAQRINNLLVIYHGITNYLRVGDFTLFNLETEEIEGIGEIKSTVKGETNLNVTAYISSNKESLLGSYTHQTVNEFAPLDRARQERLNRQLGQMHDLRKSYTDDKPVDRLRRNFPLPIESICQRLETLKPGAAAGLDVAKGVYALAYRTRTRTLASRLYGSQSEAVTKALKNVSIDNAKILLRDHGGDHIITGPMLYGRKPKNRQLIGEIPPFWWPISKAVSRQIVFQEIIVVTFVNIAILDDMLRDRGYQLHYKGGYIDSIGYQTNERKILMNSATAYGLLRPVFCWLDTLESVTSQISQIFQRFKKKDLPRRSKINLSIVHHLEGIDRP